MSDPTNLTLADLMADLEASEAEIEAGEIVPAEIVFAELEASLARLEAKLASADKARAVSRK